MGESAERTTARDLAVILAVVAYQALVLEPWEYLKEWAPAAWRRLREKLSGDD